MTSHNGWVENVFAAGSAREHYEWRICFKEACNGWRSRKHHSHFKFFRQMPVVGVIIWRQYIVGRSLLDIGEDLYAIAGCGSDTVGKPAFKIQQYPARLKQEENG